MWQSATSEQAAANEDPTASGDRGLISKQSNWFSIAETFTPVPAKLVKRIQSLEFFDLA